MPLSSAEICSWRAASIISIARNSSSVISERVMVRHGLGAHDPEAPAHQDTIGRVHGLIEQVPGAGWTVADIDGLPAGAACRASVQFRLRRVAALPAAEHPVRALLLWPAERSLAQHRPDQELHARSLGGIGRRYSGSSSPSIARYPITSDTAADLCTIGTGPAYPSCETCSLS